ncbi:MAG: hypothetical protein KAS32_26795 [Candidatus Peribacteraceae bacterium]|nr:hypothetical protein [Candidatus Peribacteraceae bacterium]
MRLISFILITVMTVGVQADWIPSGPRHYYDSHIDQSKISTGGPLLNYRDNGVWRSIKPEFVLDDGWLRSDSGVHQVAFNVGTNKIYYQQDGHILGLDIGNLYAYRKSTNERFWLASPDFNKRSYVGATVTFTDIYPNVDLTITNSSDDLTHYFTFSQLARDQIETWWQNTGQLDDIYIVNTFKVDASRLNLSLSDSVGSVSLDSESDITNLLTFGEGLFYSQRGLVELHKPDSNSDRLYRRMMRVNGETYLAEGFPWSEIRTWDQGSIGHNATFGNTSLGGSAGAIEPGTNNKISNKYVMNNENGTITSITVGIRDNWNGDDTVIAYVYDDNATFPNSLIDTAFIEVESSTISWVQGSSTMSGSLTASAVYWIGSQNITSVSANTALAYTSTSDLDGVLVTDPTPLDDPWSGGSVASRNTYSIYITYTASGGAPEQPSGRRRKILVR